MTFGKTFCGALALACIVAGAACTNSNANNVATPTPTPANTNATSTTSPTAREGDFTGASNKPVFNEAFAKAWANAIAAAKKDLNSLKVEWRLEELSGVHGGYIPQHSTIVKIHARAANY